MTLRTRYLSLAAIAVPVAVVAGCGGSSPSQSASTTSSAPPPAATASAAATQIADGGKGKSVSFSQRLRSARIADENLDDKDKEFAEFCFRAPIQEINKDGKGFAVQGSDSDDRVTASSVRIAEDDNNCALVGFDSGTDLRSYTLGLVTNDAVSDNQGDGNIQDSIALSGASREGGRGRTSGPDLTGASREQSLNRIRFRFDEQLDESSQPRADAFGFYTATGDRQSGASIASIEGDEVTVKFAEGAGAQVENARRTFVEEAAVKDQAGTPNPLGFTGGRTAAPDLVSVKRVPGSDSQFDFRFDEAVTAGDPKGFVVFADDAKAYAARDSSSESSPLVVRASFPEEVEDFPGSLTLAAAGAGATKDGDGNDSTLGAAAVGTAESRPGRTNGPDLLAVKYGESSDQATFVFDEPVDDNGPMKADAFAIVTRDDEIQPAQDVVEINGRTAIVRFSEDALKEARGATIGDAAVKDYEGSPNPPHTVAVER